TRSSRSTGRCATGSALAPQDFRSATTSAFSGGTSNGLACSGRWKGSGIFARLAYRDGKRGYIDDMPRVMSYLRRACERYRALHPLLALIDSLDDRAARGSSG